MAQLHQEQLRAFFHCGAIAFFSSLPTKRVAFKRLETMQSYTNRADELYLEAENVKLPDYNHLFTSCYKTLYQQEKLIKHAKTMEDSATQIRHRFRVFAYSGFSLPTSTLLRKAVVSIKKQADVLYRTAFACGANDYGKQTLLALPTKK